MLYQYKNKIISILNQVDNQNKSNPGIFSSVGELKFNFKHPTKGHQSNHLYDYQKQILQSLDKNSNTIVLNGRQVGVTALNMIAAVSHAVIKPFSNIVFLLPNVNQCGYTSNAFEDFLSLNNFKYTRSTKYKFRINDYSNITFMAATSNPSCMLKETTIDFTIIDNAAFISNLQEWMQELSCAMSTSRASKLLITSSANYNTDHFCTLWYTNFINVGKIYIPRTTHTTAATFLEPESYRAEYLGEFKRGTPQE